MLAAHRPRLLPPMPPAARLLLSGTVVGLLVYVLFALSRPPATGSQPPPPPEVIVRVPQLDHDLLSAVRDGNREERLRIEKEPLRHLLEESLDVVPSVAKALGMPTQSVPLARLRANPTEWRQRWLGYQGELVDLTGPREGHPVPGYGIYEATVRLSDGELVLATFAVPPPPDIRRTGVVRVEGYLLKLRDTTYPRDLQAAPWLVGREIRVAYPEWGPVTELDPVVFEGLDESCWPGTKAWHTISEDQDVPLWHLAAWVRDTAEQRSFAEWRKLSTLNDRETLPMLNAGKLERGAPVRVLGTLIKRQVLAAEPNPAGIEFWTIAWVQVPDLKGHLVPIWVPRRDDSLPLRSSLEVLGHYYRWYAYEGLQNDRFRVPLFVANDLREFHRDTRAAMHEIGLVVGSLVLVMMLGFWWTQRRSGQESEAHSRAMDARRRRRREQTAAGPKLTTGTAEGGGPSG